MGFFDGIVDTVGSFLSDNAPAIAGVGAGLLTGDPELAFDGVIAGGDGGLDAAAAAFPSGGGFDALGALGKAGDVFSKFGPAVSGFLGYQGQSSANAANVAIANRQMDFQRESRDIAMGYNADQVAKQRGWEESMSNTSWQRGVADMEAAGLNPMLAYSRGGASTPSSSAGSVGTLPGAGARVESAAAAGINSAAQAATVRATLAGATKAESEAALNYATIPKVEQETRTGVSAASELESRASLQQEQKMLTTQAFVKLQAEVDRIAEQNALTRAQVAQVKAETINAFLNGERIKASTGNIQVDTQLRQLDVPRMRNEAASQQSHPRLYQDVLPFVGSVAKGVGSAAALGWLLK